MSSASKRYRSVDLQQKPLRRLAALATVCTAIGAGCLMTGILRPPASPTSFSMPSRSHGTWDEIAAQISALEDMLEENLGAKPPIAGLEEQIKKISAALTNLSTPEAARFRHDWDTAELQLRVLLSPAANSAKRPERERRMMEVALPLRGLEKQARLLAERATTRRFQDLQDNPPSTTPLLPLAGILVLLGPPLLFLLASRKAEARERALAEGFDARIQGMMEKSRQSTDRQKRDVQEGLDAVAKAQADLRSVTKLISSASMILWAVDTRGIYTFRDGRGLTALGQASGEGVGKHYRDVPEGDPGISENMERVLEGESFFAEHRQGERWYVTRFDPLRDTADQLVGICGITTDITQRKIAEQRAIEEEGIRQATRLKTEFMANMSHELRTPMNGIVGMVGLLGSTRLSDEQQGMLDVIQSSTDNLLRTVNDIIDLTKLEAGKLSLAVVEFRIRDIVYDVLRTHALAAERKGVELIVDVDANARQTVKGDADRVRQLLASLVDNAVKFTKQGHVLVQVRCRKSEETTPTYCINICDTGVGIEPERLADLLKPQAGKTVPATRKVGDVGFGLPIAKLLTDLFRGTMEMQSTVGQGTSVDLVLSFPEVADAQPTPEIKLRGKRILVIDDSEVTRGILALKLAAVGAKIDVALNGHEAMKACLEAAERESLYDLAIVDRLMPVVDGPTFASMVRGTRELASLPMLLLSSSAEPLGGARRALFASELPKPIDDLALVEAIAALLGKGAPSEESATTPAVPTETGESGPLRLLIADDNPVNLTVCKKMLEKLGHTVRAVEDGRELVAALDTERFDAVFTDCQMPVMDGYEATRQIRASAQAWSDIWIVAVTANATVADRQNCTAVGMNDFIAKPLRVASLESAIRTFRSAARANPR